MKLTLIILLLALFSFSTEQVMASDNKLGVHILYADEIGKIGDLLPNGGYVTVPMGVNDLDKGKWQEFFRIAGDRNFIPIIRLATEFVDKSWRQPTKKDIVDFSKFLNGLDWKRDNLIVVLFNEPNQAGEWGGKISPDKYGELMEFALNWFKTEKRTYIVLPAALDAAADGRNGTMPAGVYLRRLADKYPEAIADLDGWNSHAYPNPGFSGKPTDVHSASIKSYDWELKYLKTKFDKDFPVYITETGWDNTKKSSFLIAQYFRYAYMNVWQADERVEAVTPFLYNAQTLPFSKFSLVNKYDQPTPLYDMIKELNKDVSF